MTKLAARRDEEADEKPRRGRPRCLIRRHAVLESSLVLLGERGFRGVTMEAIAEHAGVGKVTLYRHWPSKAAIFMDAFLAKQQAEVPFGDTGSALDDLRIGMLSLMKLFRGPMGPQVAGLIAEGILDPEVGEILRTRWVRPRRAEAAKIVQRGIDAGQLPKDCDAEALLDALYGPIYLRLMLGHEKIDRAFVEKTFATVTKGIRP